MKTREIESKAKQNQQLRKTLGKFAKTSKKFKFFKLDFELKIPESLFSGAYLKVGEVGGASAKFSYYATVPLLLKHTAAHDEH